jgi:cation diffusion facilitator CzcD-associated flavoprotein CzcO
MFAPGDEIQRYLRDVVERFGLDDRLRLNAEVVSTVFTGSTWQITTADGVELEADFVIGATGVLHHPFTPDIPGLDTFGGDVVHTARWDDIATSGRRIAVIRNGSTGVQIVSTLQREAAHITHFVRTPQWVMWAPMELPQPTLLGAVLRRMPSVNRRLYDALLGGSAILADVTTKPSWRRRLIQNYARWCLRAQIRDRELRDRLTPDYQPLCKRQVVSSSYYRAIRSRNAELITSANDEITPRGIRTVDGRETEVDLLILATGFRAHNYMRPMNLRGRDGLDIDERVVAVAPFWSGTPYELLVIPRTHEAHLQGSAPADLAAVGRTIRTALATMADQLGDVSYNLVFHTAPHHHGGVYHWHAHIWPKLSTTAGFERGTGVLINIVTPEAASQLLSATD